MIPRRYDNFVQFCLLFLVSFAASLVLRAGCFLYVLMMFFFQKDGLTDIAGQHSDPEGGAAEQALTCFLSFLCSFHRNCGDSHDAPQPTSPSSTRPPSPAACPGHSATHPTWVYLIPRRYSNCFIRFLFVFFSFAAIRVLWAAFCMSFLY